jgi:hypothetical protein
LTILLGLLLGVSVDFRLPNLFLSSGYFLFFLFSLLSSRKMPIVVHGAAFTVAFLIGIAPKLLANVINAGSPFAATYGGQDLAPPDFSFGIVRPYVADMQIVLLVLAGASTAFIVRTRRQRRPAGRAGHRRKSRGESGLFPEPSSLYALLHYRYRKALVVESSLWLADAAIDGSCRKIRPRRDFVVMRGCGAMRRARF